LQTEKKKKIQPQRIALYDVNLQYACVYIITLEFTLNFSLENLLTGGKGKGFEYLSTKIAKAK